MSLPIDHPVIIYGFIMSLDAVVGIELLAINLAGKHIAIVPLFVLARHLQRLVTDITGVNPLYLLSFVPPH